MKQIRLIADVKSVNSRLEEDKKIANIYNELVQLQTEMIDFYENTETGKLQIERAGTEGKLRLYQSKEKLLQYKQSLQAKQYLIENVQNRIDFWEVQFEENSRIVNENWDDVINTANQKAIIKTSILFQLLDGYKKNKENILTDQQFKNNLYYQIVEQLNMKKVK